MDARHEQGLEFGTFSLPSFSERSGQWTDTPMSSSEIAYIIRELLQDAADGVDLRQIGSHSSNVTLYQEIVRKKWQKNIKQHAKQKDNWVVVWFKKTCSH